MDLIGLTFNAPDDHRINWILVSMAGGADPCPSST